ncbi:hypothetical protein BGX38DRAFT_1158999, partial [Terfezia claveryi]
MCSVPLWIEHAVIRFAIGLESNAISILIFSAPNLSPFKFEYYMRTMLLNLMRPSSSGCILYALL